MYENVQFYSIHAYDMIVVFLSQIHGILKQQYWFFPMNKVYYKFIIETTSWDVIWAYLLKVKYFLKNCNLLILWAKSYFDIYSTFIRIKLLLRSSSSNIHLHRSFCYMFIHFFNNLPKMQILFGNPRFFK